MSVRKTRDSRFFSAFKSYARPFILWVIGFSLLYYYLIAPIAHSILFVYGINYKLPVFDQNGLNTLIVGLLGSSALRTFEKYKNVQGNH